MRHSQDRHESRRGRLMRDLLHISIIVSALLCTSPARAIDPPGPPPVGPSGPIDAMPEPRTREREPIERDHGEQRTPQAAPQHQPGTQPAWQRANDLATQGLNYYNRGDYDAAIESYRDAFKYARDGTSTYQELETLWYQAWSAKHSKAGNYPAALDAAKKVLTLRTIFVWGFSGPQRVQDWRNYIEQLRSACFQQGRSRYEAIVRGDGAGSCKGVMGTCIRGYGIDLSDFALGCLVGCTGGLLSCLASCEVAGVLGTAVATTCNNKTTTDCRRPAARQYETHTRACSNAGN